MIEEIDTKGIGTEVKLSRFVSQAPCKASMIEVTDKNGVVKKRNPITVTDEKIVDTCLQIFQETKVAKKINYKEIREVVEREIEEKFIKYGLVVSQSNTKRDNEEIQRKREIAIAKEIREHIVKNFDMSFKVGFDEFIALTGVKSAKRFGNALDMVLNIQEKNFFEWKQESISDDFSEYKFELSKVCLLPSITIVLNTDKFKDISDFQKSKVRNKSQYIDYIKLGLNPEYIASVVGLGRDFTMSDRKIRNEFKISYSFRLDWLIRSIIKVQYNSNINYYTIPELQDLFGTDYADVRNFLSKVIIPAVKEINKFSELEVEVIHHRDKNKIIAISFSITIKDREDMRNGADKVAYYISSRLYYFSDEKINSIIGFAKHIAKTSKDSLFTVYGTKDYNEWEDEAKIAYAVEKDVLQFLEEEYKDFFISQKIIYNKNKMCIMKEVLVIDNCNDSENNTVDFKSSEQSDENISSILNDDEIPQIFSGSEILSDSPSENSMVQKNDNNRDGKKLTVLKEPKIEHKNIYNERNEMIQNPMQSLTHLKTLLSQKQMYFSNEAILEKVSILDALPFSISIEDGETKSTLWKKVENENDYNKYAELIKLYVVAKKINLFLFEDDYSKELFFTNMVNENFSEIEDDFRAKVRDVTV